WWSDSCRPRATAFSGRRLRATRVLDCPGTAELSSGIDARAGLSPAGSEFHLGSIIRFSRFGGKRRSEMGVWHAGGSGDPGSRIPRRGEDHTRQEIPEAGMRGFGIRRLRRPVKPANPNQKDDFSPRFRRSVREPDFSKNVRDEASPFFIGRGEAAGDFFILPRPGPNRQFHSNALLRRILLDE